MRDLEDVAVVCVWARLFCVISSLAERPLLEGGNSQGETIHLVQLPPLTVSSITDWRMINTFRNLKGRKFGDEVVMKCSAVLCGVVVW